MRSDQTFQTTMQRVIGMPQDASLCERVRKLGLNVVNVMWEDTSRTPGSVWGPNISDMTLQVRDPDHPDRTELLPVIRYPNFTDKTGDVSLDLFRIKVGNERGKEPQVITLREYLNNLPQYVSYPKKIHPENKPLVTEKDTHILISAQACFLPIPPEGRGLRGNITPVESLIYPALQNLIGEFLNRRSRKCRFNPVLFNYQSRTDNPAVLTILITTEGSSATVIDNTNDKASWGQNLYFNNNGQKTCLTGERLSDYKENQAREIAQQQGISLEDARSRVTVAQDVNMVIVVQVPLKYKEIEFKSQALSDSMFDYDYADCVCSFSLPWEKSDMEDAVIGHGEDEGEHLELGGYKLERDERFPIRATVQFYKATSNGIIDDEDLENIRQCIEAAYTSADYIGSLVVGTLEKGRLGMGQARPTQPAPSEKAVLAPPKDFLKVVNPFAPHQKPKT